MGVVSIKVTIKIVAQKVKKGKNVLVGVGNSGLVVEAGESCSIGCGFKSQHQDIFHIT